MSDCVEATVRLMRSEFQGPVNIGSEEMVSINQLAQKIIDISGKRVGINNLPGPEGVRGRNSDNNLIKAKLDWEPTVNLSDGLTRTYEWIGQQYGIVTK